MTPAALQEHKEDLKRERAERIQAVHAASVKAKRYAATGCAIAADQINSNLSIAASAIALAQVAKGQEHAMLAEANAALQRIAWVADGLLQFARRRGARPIPMQFDVWVEHDAREWLKEQR